MKGSWGRSSREGAWRPEPGLRRLWRSTASWLLLLSCSCLSYASKDHLLKGGTMQVGRGALPHPPVKKMSTGLPTGQFYGGGSSVESPLPKQH